MMNPGNHFNNMCNSFMVTAFILTAFQNEHIQQANLNVKFNILNSSKLRYFQNESQGVYSLLLDRPDGSSKEIERIEFLEDVVEISNANEALSFARLRTNCLLNRAFKERPTAEIVSSEQENDFSFDLFKTFSEQTPSGNGEGGLVSKSQFDKLKVKEPHISIVAGGFHIERYIIIQRAVSESAEPYLIEEYVSRKGRYEIEGLRKVDLPSVAGVRFYFRMSY